MNYLKVFTDFVEDMKELGDAERGRLFTAMLEYAATGIEPDLRGNERFLWGTAKKNIDNQRGSYETRCAANAKNGALGGKRTQANVSEIKRTQAKSSDSLQDKDKEKDYKEILPNGSTKKAAAASFRPPTVEEVQTYCKERGNSVNAEAFVDYYAARGWCLSNGVKVKDWRACVRTWEQRDKERGKKHGGQNFEQRTVHMSELDNIIGGDRE